MDSSKLKEFADDNFKFDENGGKFSEKVENIAGKGEIARYEQFLFFPQCFQKTCTADTKKPGLVWERVKGNKRNGCFLRKYPIVAIWSLFCPKNTLCVVSMVMRYSIGLAIIRS